jgi:hypothetical protein
MADEEGSRKEAGDVVHVRGSDILPKGRNTFTPDQEVGVFRDEDAEVERVEKVYK